MTRKIMVASPNSYPWIFRMLNRAWTSDDEQRLLKLRARGASWRLIGLELSRSEASVASRFLKLQRSDQPSLASLTPHPANSPPANSLHAETVGKLSDKENAQRLRDKAAEALQMVDFAETQSRRAALLQMVDHYTRTADQLDGLIGMQPISDK